MTTRMVVSLCVATALLTALASAPVSALEAESPEWIDVSAGDIPQVGDRPTVPDRHRTVAVDIDELTCFLESAPLERTEGAKPIEFALPLPDGSFGRFAILESPIMAPELAARFPEIRTYSGVGLDDRTATARLSITPMGFHAYILSAGESVYIDPYQRQDVTHYQSYFRNDLQFRSVLESCALIDEDNMAEEIAELVGNSDGNRRSGTELRTYRTAIAATGEYTQYHGGTVAAGMAAINVALNRVTGIYEREVSIRMELIPNNDLIVYTNGATDPYTNNNGSAMLSQNQSNLDSVIGSANYDIGHVFSTGGGGIAYLGCVCRAGVKARGVTGLPYPIGDRFYVDYVAHEMGHQYGANHSFNGNSGGCSGNRNWSTAYEPGSGSTIMAYAGLCSGQNIQGFSDDYFVWISIQEIISYTTSGSGNSCPVVTGTGVVEPDVNAGQGGFWIPLDTPFELTCEAATTGAPTYSWEESDRGPAGHPNFPTGTAPIFRSFDYVETETRVFPKLSDLLRNQQTMGEILPSYSRDMSFRITVRDFQAGGVGVTNDYIAFDVADIGPFLVTYPNTDLTWLGGSNETVQWDVASTDGAPVNCANVDIHLSVDGGYTWPHLLAANTPNDGSESVTVPDVGTYIARIKVKAADSVFFDVSDEDFEIEESTVGVEDASTVTGLLLHASNPNPFALRTTISFETAREGEVSLAVYDAGGRLVRTLVGETMGIGSHQVAWDGSDANGQPVASGVYFYELSVLGDTRWGRVTLLN